MLLPSRRTMEDTRIMRLIIGVRASISGRQMMLPPVLSYPTAYTRRVTTPRSWREYQYADRSLCRVPACRHSTPPFAHIAAETYCRYIPPRPNITIYHHRLPPSTLWHMLLFWVKGEACWKHQISCSYQRVCQTPLGFPPSFFVNVSLTKHNPHPHRRLG